MKWKQHIKICGETLQTVIRRKFISLNAFKKKKSTSQWTKIPWKKLEKEQTEHKASRRKEILTCKEEIYKIFLRSNNENQWTGSWFFKIINKTDKPLPRLLKKKDGRFNTNRNELRYLIHYHTLSKLQRF